jgi:TRAP-type C4-dicarboxylate transport system permease small subunit
LAMLGALAAARDDKHLGIDALFHNMRPEQKRWAKFFGQLFAAVISAFLAYYAWLFVREEWDVASTENIIPSWLALGIVPLAFGLMSWRFGRRALRVLLGSNVP